MTSIYSNTTKSLIILCVVLGLISLILLSAAAIKGQYYNFNTQCPPAFRNHFNFSRMSSEQQDRLNKECTKELFNEVSCFVWQSSGMVKKGCPHQVVLIPGICLLSASWLCALFGLVFSFTSKDAPPTLKFFCYLNFWRNPLYEMLFASRLILLSCVPIAAFLLSIAFSDYPCTHSTYKRPVAVFLEYGLPVPSINDVKSCASLTTWIYQDGCLVCGLVLAFSSGLMACSASMHVAADIRAYQKGKQSESDLYFSDNAGGNDTVSTVYGDDDKVKPYNSEDPDMWKVKSQIIIAL